MATKKVSIRHLIDVAIGSPEPGIVNFNALYTVLQAMSERLDLQDEQIEVDSSFCPVTANIIESKSNVSSERFVDHQIFNLMSEMVEEGIKELAGDECEVECQKSNHIEQPQKAIDDRKVVFGTDEEVLSTHSARRTKEADRRTSQYSELRQHVDVLHERLGKIENMVVSSADTDQNVDCLRQIVYQFQGKLDSLEQTVDELKKIRNTQEQDISACRKKLEHEKLAAVTDGLKHELAELRDTINNFKNKQTKSPLIVSHPDVLSDIKTDYSKLQTQLIELKTNLCNLSEQFASLELNLSHSRRSSSLNTFQQEISALREYIESANVDLSSLHTDHETQKSTIEELTSKLDELARVKIDREEVDELMSEKADYTMLQRKVSVENIDADRRKLEKQISEITECLVANEERVQKQISDLNKFLGERSFAEMLYDFKVKVDNEIQVLRNAIKRLTEIKPDADAAAARLRNLTCLSCDQDVVMKTIEMNNLSKFGDAYVSKSISPLIAFEVGKLRQAGKMGFVDMEDTLCEMGRNFRHSGGMHTIITNQDRVSKIRSRKHK